MASLPKLADQPVNSDLDAPVVITFGNPSRGDDAIGPLVYAFLEKAQSEGILSSDIKLLTDFQLQIEQVTDLAGRKTVIFVDAARELGKPFVFLPVSPAMDEAVSTHKLSASRLLSIYEQVYAEPAPHAFILAIEAYQFELGAKISEAAESNFNEATKFLLRRLSGLTSQIA